MANIVLMPFYFDASLFAITFVYIDKVNNVYNILRIMTWHSFLCFLICASIDKISSHLSYNDLNTNQQSKQSYSQCWSSMIQNPDLWSIQLRWVACHLHTKISYILLWPIPTYLPPAQISLGLSAKVFKFLNNKRPRVWVVGGMAISRWQQKKKRMSLRWGKMGSKPMRSRNWVFSYIRDLLGHIVNRRISKSWDKNQEVALFD